ncbi:HNH endonuclease [Fictibacillus fluitans]|uniref:HNH endonuclease n=1 Tax=Fictibacillus fluitans TaxID=3058422 RepID=A0ABT8HUF0_9BACL|nr:HNH endonuclease [Fictibacillus sp. NE201]MDN4524407.1 HNH endonuclease [Fictibacillus sp. NE201]
MEYQFHNTFPEIIWFSKNEAVEKGYQKYKKFFFEDRSNNEFQIWEFKVQDGEYLLSIKDNGVFLHLHIPMKRMEGNESTRSAAIEYFFRKYRVKFFNDDNRLAICSYSYNRSSGTTKALVRDYQNVQELIERSGIQFNLKKFPIMSRLKPKKRSREFAAYEENFRDLIVYEYLFNSRTHRWLDEFVLGFNPAESRGYQSMSILHFIGIREKHKGIFSCFTIEKAINLLENQQNDFEILIACLLRCKLEIDGYSNEDTLGEQTVLNTERQRLVMARYGQSIFKKALLSKDSKCCLCEISDRRFLIASHIKPWSKSNHLERLDYANGLLLCPNHDALFDKGFITFDSEGQILISGSLNEKTRFLLNINENMKIEMAAKRRYYLEWHRENVFEKSFQSKGETYG